MYFIVRKGSQTHSRVDKALNINVHHRALLRKSPAVTIHKPVPSILKSGTVVKWCDTGGGGGTLNILTGSGSQGNEWWLSNVTGFMQQNTEDVSVLTRMETSGIHTSRPGDHDKWIMVELKEFKNISAKILKRPKRWSTAWAHNAYFSFSLKRICVPHSTKKLDITCALSSISSQRKLYQHSNENEMDINSKWVEWEQQAY